MKVVLRTLLIFAVSVPLLYAFFHGFGPAHASVRPDRVGPLPASIAPNASPDFQPEGSESGPFAFSFELSDENPLPGDSFELVLIADSVEYLQYFGLELAYDTSRFSFDAIQPGTLFDGQAVYIAEHLPDAQLGASVSSTAGEVSGAASLLHLHFTAGEKAPSGTFEFTLTHTEARDADNNPLNFDINNTASGKIPAYLTDTGMISPGSIAMARGTEVTFRFRLTGDGLTESLIANEERLRAEMGIIALDESGIGGGEGNGEAGSASNPAGWPSESWSGLQFSHQDADTFYFESVFPQEITTGTWLAAGRFQIDDQPPLFAGYGPDDGGNWDGETWNSAVITVTAQRVTLAHWSFNSENWVPDTGMFHNLTQESSAAQSGTPPDSGQFPEDGAWFTLAGAGFNGWTTGIQGRAPNSNNWHARPDDQDNEIETFWLASLSGQGYGMYEVSWTMNGSGTGPRNFRLEYSQDGQNWHPVPGSEIAVTTAYTPYQAMLPAEADDSGELLIRWLRTGDLSINGDAISSVGTNRIDEVRVSGVPVDESETAVWPGDTNQSGSVTEEDVLNIGYYWMSRGPDRIPNLVTWQEQPVIRWIPPEAGHADTNGDGIVDYRDIMAIGRNFGNTGGEDPAKHVFPPAVASDVTEPIHSVPVPDHASPQRYTSPGPDTPGSQHQPDPLPSQSLPRLSQGDTLALRITLDNPEPILGLAVRFDLAGLPGDAWTYSEIQPGSWSGSWQETGRLLQFTRQPEADSDRLYTISAAWVHKGAADPVRPDTLILLALRAGRDWPVAPELRITRLSLIHGDGTLYSPDNGRIRIHLRTGEDDDTGKPPQKPLHTRLFPNYPNPFNPVTTIPFDIAEPGMVRLTIHDVLGRHVATLIDEPREPGFYETVWQADAVTSGLYLYQLDTPSTRKIRTMILLR